MSISVFSSLLNGIGTDEIEWGIISDKWPGFHDDAKKSKGVGKQAANDGSSVTLAKAPDASAKPALRPELQQAVDDCMEDYEYLKQFARKP